jgi:hypothetical protein
MRKILLAGLAVTAVFIVYATLYIAYALADERAAASGAGAFIPSNAAAFHRVSGSPHRPELERAAISQPLNGTIAAHAIGAKRR